MTPLETQLAELQAENAALRAVLQDAEHRLEAQRVDRETRVNLEKLLDESMRQVGQLESQLRRLRDEAATANRSLAQLQQSPYWRVTRPMRNFFARHEKARRALRDGLAKAARGFR